MRLPADEITIKFNKRKTYSYSESHFKAKGVDAMGIAEPELEGRGLTLFLTPDLEDYFTEPT